MSSDPADHYSLADRSPMIIGVSMRRDCRPAGRRLGSQKKSCIGQRMTAPAFVEGAGAVPRSEPIHVLQRRKIAARWAAWRRLRPRPRAGPRARPRQRADHASAAPEAQGTSAETEKRSCRSLNRPTAGPPKWGILLRHLDLDLEAISGNVAIMFDAPAAMPIMATVVSLRAIIAVVPLP